MTRILLYAATALTALALAAAFLSYSPWASLALVVLGAAWTWGQTRRRAWISALGLFLSCAAAVAGIILGQPPLFLVLGACLALLAWDLGDFAARLHRASPDDDVAGLEKRHLLRLGLVAIVSTSVILLSQAWKMDLSFEWLALLALVGAWGVGRIAYWMQRGK